MITDSEINFWKGVAIIIVGSSCIYLGMFIFMEIVEMLQ